MPSLPPLMKLLACIALVACSATTALAQSAAEGATGENTTTKEASVETLSDGFAKPCAVALRPGGARSGPNLFVAEAATCRVLGMSTSESKSGFVEVIKPGSKETGESGCRLVFRSRNRLLMGQTTLTGGKAIVSEYDIDDDALPMDSADRSERFEYSSKEQSVSISSMARNGSSLFVATGEHQWLLGGTIKKGQATKLEPLVRSIDVTQTGNPSAVAFGDKGYLVVVEIGEASTSGDSVLVFYHPGKMDSEPLLKVAVDLDDVVAIAYSPATGNLYAANASSGKSGVYRLDATFDPATRKQSCSTVLVAEVQLPCDMAFADDGTLYVVSSETTKPDDSSGKLLKITGGL